jgi:hypothetical protein
VLTDYKGLKFSDITSLRYYQFHWPDSGGVAATSIALTFTVDYDVTDTSTDASALVYYPEFTGSAGNWESVDAMTGAHWTASQTASKRGGVSVANPCQNATKCTWSQILSVFPNAGISATAGNVYFVSGRGPVGSQYRNNNVDKFTLGIGGINTTFDFEAGPRKHLAVLVDSGVTGSPSARDSLMGYDEPVAYSYHAPAGGILKVYLDTLAVADSGVFTMSQARSLIVSVRPDTALRSGDMAVYNSIRALLVAGNPVVAYQSLLNTMAAVAYANDVEAGDSSINRSIIAAIDPVADSATLRHLDGVLAGHVFDYPPNLSSYSRLPRGRNRLADSRLKGGISRSSINGEYAPDPAIFVVINGIYNNAVDAAGSTRKILRLIKAEKAFPDAALDADSLVHRVSLFYNPTREDQSPDLTARDACISNSGFMRYSGLGWVLGKACQTFMYYVHDDDLLEARRQLMSIIANTPAHDSVTNALADSIAYWRAHGRHVVLVPHSQGNLVSSIAIKRLEQDNRLARNGDPTCISIAALAPPNTDFGPIPSAYIWPVLLYGDPIYDAPGPKFGRLQNARYDNIIANYAPYDLEGGRLTAELLLQSISMHKLENYLSDDGGVDYVRAAIQSAYDACTPGQFTVTPVIDSMMVGTTQQVAVKVKNVAGDSIHNPRPMVWSGLANSTGLVTMSSPFGGDIFVHTGAYGAGLFIKGYSLPPSITSASCSKDSPTQVYTVITTNYHFGAAASPGNPGYTTIVDADMALQYSWSNHADSWLNPSGVGHNANWTTVSASWQNITYSSYADGPEVGGPFKPNGNCRVRVKDSTGKWSNYYFTSF